VYCGKRKKTSRSQQVTAVHGSIPVADQVLQSPDQTLMTTEREDETASLQVPTLVLHGLYYFFKHELTHLEMYYNGKQKHVHAYFIQYYTE
jgi:hypothetical protein